MEFELDSLFSEEIVEKHIEPDRIFASLIQEPEYEYLRGVQTEILDEWYQRRNDRDIILKMNTGAGKTLVGLLALQSSLNEGIGPAIFLCPDYQLVEQVMSKSRDYGFKCVTFDENNNNIPQEFLNSEAILVAVFDKVFNGQSKFDRCGIDVGTIIMDDAHLCINKTREKFTIKITNQMNEYSQILSLFENDLKIQDVGTFNDINLGFSRNDIMQVPHWTWMNNNSEIVRILSEGAAVANSVDKKDNNQDYVSLYFSWSMLKRNIESCYCFVSKEVIEITPFCIPIKEVRAFHNAKRRIFMSATLLDDSILIKELDVSENAVKNPLINKMYYNIGERMILLPSLLHNCLNRETVSNICKKKAEEGNNVVILVSSFNEKIINEWKKVGAQVARRTDIIEKVAMLSQTNNNLLVFANRYDGIDLKGDQCRILVIDGLPGGTSLFDKFVNNVRSSSKIIRAIQSQRIEQGIGRSTRSSNDYSVVIILGDDLVTFMSMNDNKALLSPQTKMQVDIGLNFSKKAGINEENAVDALNSIIEASIGRNKGWITFHNNQVQKATADNYAYLPLEITVAERRAYDLYSANRAMEAANLLNSALNNHIKVLNSDDIGWFIQIVSSYMYKADRSSSMELQLKAHEHNSLLCKAPEGVKYKKLDKKIGVQAQRVLMNVKQYSEPNAFIMMVNDITSKLNFGIQSNSFEDSLCLLGRFLGFDSQRPEKEYNKGCDVLWHMANNQFIIFEAKNEVKSERNRIYKSEAEQITNSFNWFRNEDYVGEEGYPIIIHPTRVCANDASPDPAVLVMDKEKLELLVKNITGFVVEVAHKMNMDISINDIAELLLKYKLRSEDICLEYTKKTCKI